MHKKLVLYSVAFFVVATFFSCHTSKQLPYFKDLPDTATLSKISTSPYEPLKLQPNDELQITISSVSAEASHFFNLATSSPTPSASPGSVATPSSAGLVNLYHVSFNGNYYARVR